MEFPKPETPAKCVFCGWEGTVKDCKRVFVKTSPRSWRMLAGREGYEWKCPECQFVVYTHYYRMS